MRTYPADKPQVIAKLKGLYINYQKTDYIPFAEVINSEYNLNARDRGGLSAWTERIGKNYGLTLTKSGRRYSLIDDETGDDHFINLVVQLTSVGNQPVPMTPSVTFRPVPLPIKYSQMDIFKAAVTATEDTKKKLTTPSKKYSLPILKNVVESPDERKKIQRIHEEQIEEIEKQIPDIMPQIINEEDKEINPQQEKEPSKKRKRNVKKKEYSPLHNHTDKYSPEALEELVEKDMLDEYITRFCEWVEKRIDVNLQQRDASREDKKAYLNSVFLARTTGDLDTVKELHEEKNQIAYKRHLNYVQNEQRVLHGVKPVSAQQKRVEIHATFLEKKGIDKDPKSDFPAALGNKVNFNRMKSNYFKNNTANNEEGIDYSTTSSDDEHYDHPDRPKIEVLLADTKDTENIARERAVKLSKFVRVEQNCQDVSSGKKPVKNNLPAAETIINSNNTNVTAKHKPNELPPTTPKLPYNKRKKQDFNNNKVPPPPKMPRLDVPVPVQPDFHFTSFLDDLGLRGVNPAHRNTTRSLVENSTKQANPTAEKNVNVVQKTSPTQVSVRGKREPEFRFTFKVNKINKNVVNSDPETKKPNCPKKG